MRGFLCDMVKKEDINPFQMRKGGFQMGKMWLTGLTAMLFVVIATFAVSSDFFAEKPPKMKLALLLSGVLVSLLGCFTCPEDSIRREISHD